MEGGREGGGRRRTMAMCASLLRILLWYGKHGVGEELQENTTLLHVPLLLLLLPLLLS